MKKIIVNSLILCLSLILFCGCFASDQSLSIVTSIDKSLNKLEKIVRKLDVIDNNYIANSDLYIKQINNATLSNNPDNSINEVLNNAIVDLIEEKLNNKCSSNKNNSNKNCESCDNNFLENYVNKNFNSSKNNQPYFTENSLNNQNKSPCSLPSPYPSSKKINTDNGLNNIDDLVFHSDEKDNNFETKNIPFESETLNDSSIELLEENLPKRIDSNKKTYVYTDDDFTPDNLRYNPRYITKYDSSTASNQLNNYISKIQKLYAVSEDVLEANNVLKLYKTNLIDIINISKQKNNELKKYINQTSSPQKIQAIKNYISDLNTTTNRLKTCNGQLNNEISNINSSNSSSISLSIDIINSNYIKILNHLDTRINYHENAIATINQLNYLIDDLIFESANNEFNTESNIDSYNPQSNLENNDGNINLTENNPQENEYLQNSNNNSQLLEQQNIENNNLSNNQTDPIIDNNESININPNSIPDNSNLNYDLPYYYENDSVNNANNNYIFNNKPINSLINQNNLNTDNNRDFYYYENNGSLKNAKNNEYLLNNNTNNTNIDTYNYNTLVDSINRGTIDNGINKLSAQAIDKPIMVNDEKPEILEENNMNDENYEKLKELTTELNHSLGPNSSDYSDEFDEVNQTDTNENNDEKINNNSNQTTEAEKKEHKLDLNYNNNIEEPSIEFLEDENITESYED